MRRQAGIIIALVMSLAACQHMGLGGGDGTPTVTRTGEEDAAYSSKKSRLMLAHATCIGDS